MGRKPCETVVSAINGVVHHASQLSGRKRGLPMIFHNSKINHCLRLPLLERLSSGDSGATIPIQDRVSLITRTSQNDLWRTGWLHNLLEAYPSFLPKKKVPKSYLIEFHLFVFASALQNHSGNLPS